MTETMVGIMIDVASALRWVSRPLRTIPSILLAGLVLWSFLEQGCPAILAIEDMGDTTPFYHEATDTLSTLDLDYYADFTCAAIATTAHLGRLLPGGYLSGTVYALNMGLPPSATVDAVAPTYHYTFTALTGTDRGYFLSLPSGDYTLTIWPVSPAYRPAIVTDVLIITDSATVQDVALKPWLRLYLPRVIYGS